MANRFLLLPHRNMELIIIRIGILIVFPVRFIYLASGPVAYPSPPLKLFLEKPVVKLPFLGSQYFDLND